VAKEELPIDEENEGEDDELASLAEEDEDEVDEEEQANSQGMIFYFKFNLYNFLYFQNICAYMAKLPNSKRTSI
jgi:hypothetical protein